MVVNERSVVWGRKQRLEMMCRFYSNIRESLYLAGLLVDWKRKFCSTSSTWCYSVWCIALGTRAGGHVMLSVVYSSSSESRHGHFVTEYRRNCFASVSRWSESPKSIPQNIIKSCTPKLESFSELLTCGSFRDLIDISIQPIHFRAELTKSRNQISTNNFLHMVRILIGKRVKPTSNPPDSQFAPPANQSELGIFASVATYGVHSPFTRFWNSRNKGC